eukprot:COSAG06_NODE_7977_length_2313_cov_6.997098_1_plen_700_part_10
MVPVNPADQSVEAASPSRARRSGSPPARASARRRVPSTYSSAAVGGDRGEYRQLVSPQSSLAGEDATKDAELPLSMEPTEGEKQRQISSAACGCCIGGDGDNGEEEALVLPPTFDFGGRLGPWLSTPEGAPTALSYVTYGLLGGETVVFLFFGGDGRGIFNMLGCDGLGSCSLDDAVAAADLAHYLGTCVLLASFTCVFHGLRCVTRTAEAGGQLALLGLGTACVPTSAARNLQRWRWLVRLVTWGLAVGFSGLAMQFVLITQGATRVLHALFFIAAALGFVVIGQWWLTLRLAVALTNDEAKAVAAAAEAAAERETELDDEQWRRTIEEPAQKLARVTLPLLSEGWGPSLGAVMAGLGASAIGWGATVYKSPLAWDDPVFRVIVGLVVVVAALPVLFALAPAGVSTACDELTDSLTDLHTKGDPARQYERMTPLETILDRANRKQGIGFRIGRGTVLDKKTLYFTAARVYALVVAAEALLLSSLGPELPVGGAGSLCPYGWVDLNGRCLKLFEEPKTWIAAEEECEVYGAHLASIRSQAENDVVMAMLAATSPSSAGVCGSGMYMQSSCNDWVWIGLSDAATEGTFAWSDGEPVEYQPWDRGNREPTSDNSEHGKEMLAACGAVAQDDYVAMYRVAGGKWHTWWGAVAPTCEPTAHYFVCSKPAAQMAASGGSMYGCVDGHWVVGMAHSSTGLPPTAVR